MCAIDTNTVDLMHVYTSSVACVSLTVLCECVGSVYTVPYPFSHPFPLRPMSSSHSSSPFTFLPSHLLFLLPSHSPPLLLHTVVAEAQVVHIWCRLAEAPGVHTEEHTHYCYKVHQRDRGQRYVRCTPKPISNCMCIAQRIV